MPPRLPTPNARPHKGKFDAKIVALKDEAQDFHRRLNEFDAKIVDAKRALDETVSLEKTSAVETCSVAFEGERTFHVFYDLLQQRRRRTKVLNALYRERDVVRKERQATVDAIKALRAEFRAAENAFRAQQREMRRLRNKSVPTVVDEDAPLADAPLAESFADFPPLPAVIAPTNVADGFLRSLAYEGGGPRGGDEASEASAVTFASRATSAYTAIPTVHGQERMAERDVQLRELQAAKKHGTAIPAGDGCWKYEYDGVVYVTDATQKRVITTYRGTEAPPAPGRELGDFARLIL